MIKVLIVDDELLMRIGLKSMIPWEEYGFTVIGESANGKEALQFMEKTDPGLVITDIKMPIMDGIEFIRKASSRSNSCKYVILSCLEEFQYVKEALRLGAADYLIKSDLKPNQIIEVLNKIRHKIQEEDSFRRDYEKVAGHYQKSVGYLKEEIFKELLSGLKSEEETILELKQLNVCLTPERLVLLKLSIDQFETVRKKYVEKDEKLLRFSMVNILEELIPRKWNKEIIIETSREYILVMNPDLPAMEIAEHKPSIDGLCSTIQKAIKDFMNISLTIGISNVVSGFVRLKEAYKEADLAVQNRFFSGMGRSIYFEDAMERNKNENQEILLSRHDENQFRLHLESLRKPECFAFVNSIYEKWVKHSLTELAIRNMYIRLIEMISLHLPVASSMDEQKPYEDILELDTWTELHEYTLNYLTERFEEMDAEANRQSYTERAIEFIMQYSANDISLQSVANQLHVNPSYLSRIFKQQAGDNFVRFLTKVRIDKAKYYLGTKNMKVYEVAEMVGFQNPTYFSKIFKKLVGVSPEDYRNE